MPEVVARVRSTGILSGRRARATICLDQVFHGQDQGGVGQIGSGSVAQLQLDRRPRPRLLRIQRVVEQADVVERLELGDAHQVETSALAVRGADVGG